jgi:hypothetical protein
MGRGLDGGHCRSAAPGSGVASPVPLAEACDEFAAADRLEPLAAEDLEAFAEDVQVLGRGEEAIGILRRAYQVRIEAGEIDRAVTSAFWLWQALIINT